MNKIDLMEKLESVAGKVHSFSVAATGAKLGREMLPAGGVVSIIDDDNRELAIALCALATIPSYNMLALLINIDQALSVGDLKGAEDYAGKLDTIKSELALSILECGALLNITEAIEVREDFERTQGEK